MTKPILIFPAGMPRAIDFLGKCQRDGQPVVGASSLAYDPAQVRYPAWLTLPYVTEGRFDAELASAVIALDIGGIYTPNPVVWTYLSIALQRIAPDIPLVNPSPASAELEGFRAAHALARELQGMPLLLAAVPSVKGIMPNLTALQLTALYRHSEAIPGMCDHEKLHALYEVARHCPQGDVVEIGSWWGKSAFVLLYLAQRFGIGHLLCVDPWSDAHLVQNDSDGLVDTASAQFSAEEAFGVFQANMLPYSAGDINYLRLPSADGAASYAAARTVESPAFGTTAYTGHIALLHIDGNHSYQSVKADVLDWTSMVMPGGWIILDDYIWPFGEGPKQAGNEFLGEHAARIACAFVMGGALFIQLAA